MKTQYIHGQAPSMERMHELIINVGNELILRPLRAFTFYIDNHYWEAKKRQYITWPSQALEQYMKFDVEFIVSAAHRCDNFVQPRSNHHKLSKRGLSHVCFTCGGTVNDKRHQILEN